MKSSSRLAKINLSQLPVELGETHVSSLEDLFDMLDVEGKGQLDLVEFSDGLLNLLTPLLQTPKEHEMKRNESK